MSESPRDTESGSVATAPALTAGAMLRQARKAQGVHIAVLAATMKVPTNKLEALESDRFDELPDATFTRALAKTVCRVLKIDPEPVLERLPRGPARGLERIEGGINEPFRDRPGRYEPHDWALLRSPALWGPVVLVTGAIALLVLPVDLSRTRQWFEPGGAASAAAALLEAASAPSAAGSATTVVEMPVDTPAVPLPEVATVPPTSASEPPPAAVVEAVSASTLVLTATSDSWVEVVDSSSRALISRTLLAGETVGLDGVPPLKLKIGNAHATRLSFRGQAVDLAPSTRDNVARLVLE